jgi:hypothetical protein
VNRLRLLAVAAEAASLLTVAQLAVAYLGPRRRMRLLGSAGPPSPVSAVDDVRPARRVAGIVDRVADRLPWRPVCLPRAMAARWMLRRRGIPCELRLGIASTAPLAAHAWLTAGGRVVQGGPTDHLTPLASFSSGPQSRGPDRPA